LGRSDPFFEIAKKDSDYSVAHVNWNVVYRSETISNNLNPLWEEFHIGLEELCYGKLDWPLKIRVLDHNGNGKHRTIGEFETSVADLQKHIAVKGNADRERAIQLGMEDKSSTYGLVCVLRAEGNALKAISY
jgi:Ca2+-dependent lipid-binding protein